MNICNKILSDIIVYMKYARYVPHKRRRETWHELVTRNMEMHIKKFPALIDDIKNAYQFVYDKKVLPSMRALQFSGKPIEVTPNRIFNCAYLPVDHLAAFSETMFLLLAGSGVGFSVRNRHIKNLPPIKLPDYNKKRRWLVADSIEGWADAVKILMKSYLNGGAHITFDFRDIRAKGSHLVTSGGRAPGPRPLIECLVKIEGILRTKCTGEQLTSIEIHDIICHIADAVLAGGIRRAALISLFDHDDVEMLSAKTGNWWELNPQRGRANNSAVLQIGDIDKHMFMDIWTRIERSNSGEPGILVSNDPDMGVNPCAEISLIPNQFCNLVEINASNITSQQDLNDRASAAAFIGTLQASYTDFHYLRAIWKKNTEKEALLGVSMTGIASNEIFKYDIQQAVTAILDTNDRVADLIGINRAARLTCVKPAGTTSLVLGTSSGIHAWHNDYYIRRVRVKKNEPIYIYLKEQFPELIEDEFFRPHDTAVISVPQAAPTGATLRTESPLDLLERMKKMQVAWVAPGHRRGANKHNISVTVSLRPEDWSVVGEWMWENMEYYTGISVLPYDGGTYEQAPFEDISAERYEELASNMHFIDLSSIIELDDNTDLQGEAACGGASCEIK